MAGTDISRVSADFLRQSATGLASTVQHGRRNGKLIDYDELGRALRLEKIKKGLAPEQLYFQPAQAKAVEKSLAQRTQQASRPVRSLAAAEIARHAKLSGARQQIGQAALTFLRTRQLPHARPAIGGRAALQEYLALQKLKSALASGSVEEFIARLLPLPDFSGGAPELARRFYEASQDDALLDQLLAEFELPAGQLERLKTAIRQCPHHHQTGYQPAPLAQLLARAIGIDDARPAPAQAQALLADIDDRLDEMESSEAAGRYISGALNIADEAEKTADPARFADDYAELVHGSETWGEKCLHVLDRYMLQGKGDDLNELPRTLEAASRAADLDLHAEFPSTDKVRLQAAIGSLNLIVRMRTVSEAIEESAKFIERHHGKSLSAVDLLRGLLNVFANPYAASSSLGSLAAQLDLSHPQETITVFREIDKAVRLVQQIFADVNASDAARTGVQDALDNAIAHEEMLLDQAEGGMTEQSPSAAPSSPSATRVPAAPPDPLLMPSR